MITSEKLSELTLQALGADTNSLINVMGAKSQVVQCDIPIAQEMLVLLLESLEKFEIQSAPLEEGSDLKIDFPRIIYDPKKNNLLLIYPVYNGDTNACAFFISEKIYSKYGKGKKGSFLLPFSIHQYNNKTILMPEWFGAYCLEHSENHCIPITLLSSVLKDVEDEIVTTLFKLKSWGIKCDAAISALIDLEKNPPIKFF